MGKLGKQSLRFRTAKTFFFVITFFLYQNENPVAQMGHGRQFYASLNYRGKRAAVEKKTIFFWVFLQQ
jgi:hypothetical protein